MNIPTDWATVSRLIYWGLYNGAAATYGRLLLYRWPFVNVVRSVSGASKLSRKINEIRLHSWLVLNLHVSLQNLNIGQEIHTLPWRPFFRFIFVVTVCVIFFPRRFCRITILRITFNKITAYEISFHDINSTCYGKLLKNTWEYRVHFHHDDICTNFQTFQQLFQ